MLSRHGIPHAGNFMSTEAVLVTGAVDAMGVDVQCIKQGLFKVAECYGTKLFTTNPRCRIEGAEHIEFMYSLFSPDHIVGATGDVSRHALPLRLVPVPSTRLTWNRYIAIMATRNSLETAPTPT